MIDCKYCSNKFRNNSSLNNHQKTAKYCLKLRDITIKEYKCDSCNKLFTTLTNLNRHHKTCKVSDVLSNLQDDLETTDKKLELVTRQMEDYKDKCLNYESEMLDMKREHKREIQILQDKLENVAIQAARRPTQTTNYNNRNQINTIIQNMSPLTDEHFKDTAKHLTIEHLKRGVKGYVEYALNYPLKNKVLCVDYARRKIKYKDTDGKVQTDPEMTRLSQKFFESIADKNRKLAYDCVQELSDDMDSVDKMKIMADMGQLMVDVNQSARGSKSDFTHDFVKGVCSESVC